MCRRPAAAACSRSRETQQKQRLLWRDLILRYCKHHRVYVVSAEDADDFVLFHNRAITRACGAAGPRLWRALALAVHLLLSCAAVAAQRGGCMLTSRHGPAVARRMPAPPKHPPRLAQGGCHGR